MLVLDRSLVSFRTAKIASRTSSVMLGCPARGRSHRPSMHPAGPLAFQAPAMRLSATAGKSLSAVFSTHPSLERRLAELDKVQQQLNQRQ